MTTTTISSVLLKILNFVFLALILLLLAYVSCRPLHAIAQDKGMTNAAKNYWNTWGYPTAKKPLTNEVTHLYWRTNNWSARTNIAAIQRMTTNEYNAYLSNKTAGLIKAVNASQKNKVK